MLYTNIDTIKIRLKRRGDFRIQKLNTLTPKGLNQEINSVPICCIFSVNFRLSSTNYCSKQRNTLLGNIKRNINLTSCNFSQICKSLMKKLP